MKILIIMPWIKQGGAELIATQTAYQLQRLGHQIRLAALFVDLSQMEAKARLIEYVSFGPKLANLFQRNKIFLYFFGPFFLFWLVLREAKWADIFFPHSLPAYWLAPIVAKVYQKKIVWLCNEPPKRKKLTQVGLVDWMMWLVADSFLDRLFVQPIDKVIVYSNGIAQEVRRRYGKKPKVIRLGVDFAFFSKEDKKEVLDLKRKYHLEDKFVLLMVSKLHPQKNQRLAIAVLAKILPQIKKAVLVLVGEGPDRQNLEFRIKNLELNKRVIFAGFCPPKDVRAWYAVSDLVLFPAVGQTAMVSQSWGFVPFEALCQKKVSLVSIGSGAAELLGKEKIGLVYQPTVETFSQVVWQVFAKRKECQKMAERGRRYVAENLSWEKYGQEVFKVFHEVS